LATLAVLLALATLATAPARAQRGGDSIRGLDGGTLSLERLQSGDAIVVFWASWSPRCRDIVDKVNPIHSKWSGRADVSTVNFQEAPEAIRAFLADKQLRAPVYLDDRGAFSRKHAITDLPGLVIYKDGKVAYQGKLPGDVDQLIAQYLG
jgi:thiol-disulfide isomerase/thioredoxin